jgi:TfoX/Sxy family transcriptional regulator of competence genes
MKWIKAPDELKALLEKAMEGIECEKRPMFGYPAYFINRNMFIGLFQDQVFVRLSDSQLSSLKPKFASIVNLEPMPGRPMKDYFVLPKEIYTSNRTFREIIRTAAEHARQLAPKAKKSKKK